MDQLTSETPKTKPFARLAKAFHVTRKSIIVLHEPPEVLVKSLRNLETFELCNAANLNAFDVLNAHKVLVTKTAFACLEDRVKADHASSN